MASLGYWGAVLAVVPLVSIVIATIFFLLRLYSRHLTYSKFDIGDSFMGLGLLFCYGVTICTVVSAFNGIGQDIWTLQADTRRTVTLLFWLTQIFWPLSQLFVKLSIIILLHKLLGTMERWHVVSTILTIYTTAWSITAVLGNIFQCWPPQHFWRRIVVDGTCMPGQTAFYMAIGALSLVEDVTLLSLPVGVVWRMALSVRQKIEMTVIFSVGSLVCVFSLLRLIEFRDYVTNNLTSSGFKEALWTLLELDLAIVCSSVVLMRPLYRRVRCACGCHKSNDIYSSCSSECKHFAHSWPGALPSSNGTMSAQERNKEFRSSGETISRSFSIYRGSCGVYVGESVDQEVSAVMRGPAGREDV